MTVKDFSEKEIKAYVREWFDFEPIELEFKTDDDIDYCLCGGGERKVGVWFDGMSLYGEE